MNQGPLNTLLLNGVSSGGEEINVFAVPFGDALVNLPFGNVVLFTPTGDNLTGPYPTGNILL